MLGQGIHLIADATMRQTVSPQLVAQSQILELGTEELWERIQQELQDNPALELTEETLPQPLSYGGPTVSTEVPEAAEYLVAPYTLAEDLRLQLATLPTARRVICEHLVDCLDERGFLDIEPETVARLFTTSVFEVEAAIQALQSLEPAGIGARSLRECLLLQIRRLSPSLVPAHTESFINAYLQTVRRQSPTQAAASLQLNDQQLAAILSFIGQYLYMWPADRFRDQNGENREIATLYPDATITTDGNSLQVRVAQSWARCLRVSEAYTRLDNDWQRATQAISPVERERLAEKVRAAQTFIHYLTRREAVLRRVTQVIVQRQEAFFHEGPAALEPLTRKEIASTLGVHESTISRVTRGKYLRLPDDRLVPYDFFFDSSLSAKEELRDLIANEDPGHPLSDNELTHLLVKRGHMLARRTVAKYRDALGLPPAHQRRRRDCTPLAAVA